jgi:hypothetical protein
MGRAPAGPGVEIRPAPGTQPGAILAAEGIRGHGKRKFFAHRRADVHVGYLRRKRIHGGIVRCVRISAEEHLDIRVERGNHVRKAAATRTTEPSRDPSLPEELVVTRLRQATINLHRSIEIQTEPGEGFVTGPQLTDGLYRSPVKVPNVDLKHSPKT